TGISIFQMGKKFLHVRVGIGKNDIFGKSLWVVNSAVASQWDIKFKIIKILIYVQKV
ncbi:unnamed protein product, partial [Allacma fusca]